MDSGQEYNVSRRKPNKRFQIKQTDREERIFEYLKNNWTVQKFFINNFGINPPIINGDQMPLHRNESASPRTLNFTGLDIYVKENYLLARERERVTVYTQVGNGSSIKLLAEFVFKGKGTRTKVNAPENMHYQWAPKGSYRPDQMLKTISHLPNRSTCLRQKTMRKTISVHLLPEVKEVLLKHGYVYVGIGGGITGDIQVNIILRLAFKAQK